MISNYLSFAAAILAFPSVVIVGLVLLTESVGNLHVKLPDCLVEVRNRMMQNRSTWNTREFYGRVYGFIGALIAILLQIIALSVRIWFEPPL